jgi:hypothetical protein
MAMTDEQVLEKLRELRAISIAGRKGSSRGGQARALAAGAGGPRRSDGEVAQAILAIELAMSSPAMQAVLATAAPRARSGRAAVVAPADASTVSAASSFCRIYAEVKDYIDIALEALDWVPYGSTVAKVVKLLEKFADRACRA